MSACSSAMRGSEGPHWRAGGSGGGELWKKEGPGRGQSTAKRLHGQGTKEELGLRPPATPAGRSWSWYGLSGPC